MLVDNFEQHFESCALVTQDAQMSAQNQINSLSTSRNEPMKIFRGFWIFEYALWQKNKNPKMPEINRKLCKLKTPVVNDCNCQKTAEKSSISYLSTILALITRKATLRQ